MTYAFPDITNLREFVLNSRHPDPRRGLLGRVCAPAQGPDQRDPGDPRDPRMCPKVWFRVRETILFHLLTQARPRRRPRWPKGSPRAAQREPQGASRSPKSRQRSPKGDQWDPRASKGSQKEATGSQKGAKWRPKCIPEPIPEKGSQKSPKGIQKGVGNN